jgi:hypothetical protein
MRMRCFSIRWAGVVAAAAMLSSCSPSSPGAIAHSPSPSSSPTLTVSPSPVARSVLPPAKSLPAVALCAQPLVTDQAGNVEPLLCSDGGLNVLAWKFYAPLAPKVLAAGTAASFKVVQAAICGDVITKHATVLAELNAYNLAAAYYGWSFTTDPTDVLYSMSTCPR